MKRLESAPAHEQAPWSAWQAWVHNLVQVLGAYEVPMMPDQLTLATHGLARLEDRLTRAQRLRGSRPPTDLATQTHRNALLSTARRHVDTCRLLVGTLSQRADAPRANFLAPQADPVLPDRLRQRARRAVDQLWELLEQLASLNPEEEAGGNGT
jgi:hypothetical protein